MRGGAAVPADETASTAASDLYDEATPEWVQHHLDDEYGSAWDWESFHGRSWEDDIHGKVVRDFSERAWVGRIDEMLSKGGAPNKVYLALTLPLRQAHVSLVMPENDNGETEFIESALMKPASESGLQTPIQQVIAQMTHAIAVKRMFFEKVYTQRPDGKIVYKKIMWRPPESCELLRDKRTGKIKGFKQFVSHWQREDADHEGYVTIPGERTFVYIHGSHRDPYYGVSDLEATLWAYELKMKVMALWHLFLDRAALGKIIAYAATEKEANLRAKKFAGLRNAGTLGIERQPEEEVVFEQISPDNTANATFKDMVTYLDSEMTGSVLANWADLASSSTGSKGSYALSADQSSLFLKSREAVSQEMAWAINDHIIAPLVHINFGPDAAVPQIQIEKLDSSQVDVALQLINTLGTAVTLNVPTEFVHLLVERIALFLELDPEKVRTMIDEEAERLEQQRQREEETFAYEQEAREIGLEQQALGQGTAQASQDGAQKGPSAKTTAQAAVNVASKTTGAQTPAPAKAANKAKGSSSVADSQKAKTAATKKRSK
jgi:hypothetical protein